MTAAREVDKDILTLLAKLEGNVGATFPLHVMWVASAAVGDIQRLCICQRCHLLQYCSCGANSDCSQNRTGFPPTSGSCCPASWPLHLQVEGGYSHTGTDTRRTYTPHLWSPRSAFETKCAHVFIGQDFGFNDMQLYPAPVRCAVPWCS